MVENNNNKLILVAEDDPFAQMGVKMILGQLKIPYEVVGDGLEIQKKFEEKYATTILILMDIQMPKCDGLEATRKIREFEKSKNLSRCKIYALSGDNDAKTKKSATDSGMDGLFKKPLNLDEVKQLV